MPKGVKIEDFPTKLDLVCKKLNWSRGRLAQQIGADKSLARRWFSGSSSPTDNSVMRLNEAIAKALPGFTGATWHLSPIDLARDLGIVPPPPPPSSAPTTGACGVGSGVMGLRVFQRASADFDTLVGIYAGFYRLWYQSFENDGKVIRRAMWLRRDGERLAFDVAGATLIYSGEAVPTSERLYLLGENRALEGLAFGSLVGGHLKHPSRMSGVAVFHSASRARVGVLVAPAVMEFVTPPVGDAAVDDETWKAMTAEATEYGTDQEVRANVPKEILAVLRSAMHPRNGNKGIDHILLIPPIG